MLPTIATGTSGSDVVIPYDVTCFKREDTSRMFPQAPLIPQEGSNTTAQNAYSHDCLETLECFIGKPHNVFTSYT